MRLIVIFFLLFIFLSFISYNMSDRYKQEAIDNELESSIINLETDSDIILYGYKVTADAMLESILTYPEIKTTFSKIADANDEQRTEYRKQIYETLKKDFYTYKKMGVKLILFTEPNNRVFLRMHKPDKFGDDISDVRHAIVQVNDEKKELAGFEQGKVSHAFRHIYPIYDDNKNYIGNIDISFSSEKLQKNLSEVYSLHTHFLVNKNVINSRIWPVKNVTSPYMNSIEHKDYLIFKTNDKHENIEITQGILDRNELLINESMKSSKEFAIYGKYTNNYIVLTFLPIFSIVSSDAADAYLVSYTPSTKIKSIINDYLYTNLISAVIIFLVLLLIYLMLIKRRDVLLTSKVFSTMNDGVIITDAKKKIVSVNDAFLQITQYSQKEVIGKNPSFLQSGTHNEVFYEEMWSEIYSKGKWQGEIVDKKKDGSIFTAAISIFYLKTNGRITNYISVLSDITLKKEQEKIINDLAYFDRLTNLPNRVSFYDIVNKKIASAKRTNSQFAILFIDLDNFKNINDTYGHLVGDDFLCKVAKTIKGLLRESDVLSRFGGDEFVIMIDDFERISDLDMVSGKIVKAFYDPVIIGDIEVHSGASIGIGLYPDNGKTLDELLKTADNAMYSIKNRGKNGYAFYSDSMSQ